MIAYLIAALLLVSSFAPINAKLVDQESTHHLEVADSFPVPNAQFFVFPQPSPLNIELTSEDKNTKDRADIF